MSLRLTMTGMVLLAGIGALGAGCSGGDDAEATNNQAVQNASASGPQWVRVGSGGCEGNDVGRSDGAEPTAEMCNRPWLTAVCWDGQTYSNLNGGRPWCTYKTTPASQCTGGARGHLYTCDPGTGAPPPTG